MAIYTGRQARALLHDAMEKLNSRDSRRKQRWGYYSGEHPDLPFAPEGVSQEYLELREISPVPLIRLAVRTPMQRLRVKDFIYGSDEIATRHRRIWRVNRMRSGQRIPYTHAMVYSTGLVSVWPNERVSDEPLIRTEDPNNVWVEYDPDDPEGVLWSAKHYTHQMIDDEGKWVTQQVGIVYDDQQAWRFERTYTGRLGEATTSWTDNPRRIEHNLEENPVTPITAILDADGGGVSFVDPLIPMQRAIDTMRFDLLLAAQFAAYRQRVATGYDPVLRDEAGNPIYQTYPIGHANEGELILDANNLPIPVTQSPGRVGVDRMLAFPGIDTKIFDLPESNLENYATGLNLLVASFAAAAQLPPSYLGSADFKNVSADLMVATEATLRSLIKDLQLGFGEGLERVEQKVGKATGDPNMVDPEVEVEWEETGPISLQQIADFATKMVPLGYPMREVVEMVPGVSPAKAEGLDLTPPAPATPAVPAPGEPGAVEPTPGEPVEGAVAA